MSHPTFKPSLLNAKGGSSFTVDMYFLTVMTLLPSFVIVNLFRRASLTLRVTLSTFGELLLLPSGLEPQRRF